MAVATASVLPGLDGLRLGRFCVARTPSPGAKRPRLEVSFALLARAAPLCEANGHRGCMRYREIWTSQPMDVLRELSTGPACIL